MESTRKKSGLRPAWWTAILVAVIVGAVALSYATFSGAFTPGVSVTLSSNRSGLVMEPGAKVKMRGVEVGAVDAVRGGKDSVGLKLKINPDQIRYIPANVEAQIKATSFLGDKYVEFTYPEIPSPQRLQEGTVLPARNVSTEVNTVFENLVDLLNQIDPAKLNGVLTALAEGLRGQGETMGEAISAAEHTLSEVNPRRETIREDFQSLRVLGDTYNAAAPDLVATLDAISATSTTITGHATDIDALLLNAIGVSQSGIDLIGPNRDNLVRSINTLEPTTRLLHKYNPEYTCLLVGAKWFLDNGGYHAIGGGTGYSLLTDSALLLGNDPYVYPHNLPIVAAKGGPGGKPSCGSLPDVSQNMPVRQLVTNTGWGTGMDIRPNTGLGHPCWQNFFPVTRAVPEPPSVRCVGLPSPGLPLPPPGPLPLPPAPPPQPASNPPPPGQ